MTKQSREIILLVLLIASMATANVVYVDCNGPNDPGTGAFDDPFHRIQAGIDTAIAGDTIQISPGVYTGEGNYDVDPCGKSITIRSINPEDPEVVANTVIDPNRAGRGFYIHTGENTNCVISGLTITNARSMDAYNGAGIYCYLSSPTIRNCIIRNCHADGFGGGISIDYGGTTVTNCTIMGNMADYYGGGISSVSSSTAIIGCTISGNFAGFDGGGIFSGDNSNLDVLNCIIINNYAIAQGGGINCFFRGVANVINCTIAGNTAEDIGGAVNCSKSSINVTNSILWANSSDVGTQLSLYNEGVASVAYCDVQSGQEDVYDPYGLLSWGNDNIDSDPCFGTFDPNGDPNLWDFHLRSVSGRWNSTFYKIDLNNDGTINLIEFAMIASVWVQQGNNMPEDLYTSGLIDWTDMELFAQYYLTNSIEDGWITDSLTSPCVGAGDPNSDWTAEPWPNGKRINMGAYGGTEQASKSGNIADFDIDGKVDFIDFARFAEQWNQNTNAIENMNRDSVVDALDLDIFTDNWLWSRQ